MEEQQHQAHDIQQITFIALDPGNGAMNPLVRDLYKRFMLVGRTYPGGLDVVRRRAKQAFFENAALTDEVQILRAVRIGRQVSRDLAAVSQLKKYRVLKSRYYND